MFYKAASLLALALFATAVSAEKYKAIPVAVLRTHFPLNTFRIRGNLVIVESSTNNILGRLGNAVNGFDSFRVASDPKNYLVVELDTNAAKKGAADITIVVRIAQKHFA